MALKTMDVVELHRYYTAYSMKPEGEQGLVVFAISRALSVIGLMNATFTGQIVSDEELIEKNHLTNRLEVIAEKRSISPTYLSRLFVKETEERLQDYIVRFRVERAANLLMYSEETISYIAEYVNFPSQSYMGKVFKRYKGMIPQKYRDKSKPREFETR